MPEVLPDEKGLETEGQRHWFFAHLTNITANGVGAGGGNERRKLAAIHTRLEAVDKEHLAVQQRYVDLLQKNIHNVRTPEALALRSQQRELALKEQEIIREATGRRMSRVEFETRILKAMRGGKSSKEVQLGGAMPEDNALETPAVEDVPQFTDPPNWMPADKSADEDARTERIWNKIAARLGDALESAGIGRKSDEATGFKVQGNHWLAVYSNNFKDRDGEVFPQSAIDAYVKRVDMGVTPLPELWVWHGGKNVAIGAADWVGRHGHFSMAGGQFYGADAAQAAKAYYSRHAKDTGISHGFTYPAAQFKDGKYGSYNTFEISLLPRGTEANWYTSLEGVKAMTLDDRKVKYLKDVFGEEHATRILADWDARGKALEELNVEFKDFVQPNGAEAEAVKAADSEATKAQAQILSDLIENSSIPVTAALEAVKQVKAQDAKIAALTAQVESLKALIDQRPRASQAAETVVEPSHLSPDLQQQLKQQNTVKDGFWGTEVTKTP